MGISCRVTIRAQINAQAAVDLARILRDWAFVEPLTASLPTPSLARVHECCEVLFFPIDEVLIADVESGSIDIDTEIKGGEIAEIFLHEFLSEGLSQLELACAWYEDFNAGTRWNFDDEQRRWVATECKDPNELFW
jgi:hypothetical protein